jgi:CRISPR/Cas system-associated protein Cas10 (large subunit of type III CRISPR-Cas system)
MDEFAREDVPRIAGIENPALWVYAGGDDALVLSPISCALGVANALRQKFEETVGEELRMVDPDEPATASAGIAIIHRQNPLQSGIRHAKAAEEAAKHAPYGRNALVVHRQTRGGTPQWIGGKWELELNGESQVVTELVTNLQNHIAAGRVSGKFAYELREEAPALAGVDRSGQEIELERLLNRHTASGDRPQVMPLAKDLAELSAAMGEDGIEQVAEWAVITRFLATGGRRS